MKDALSVLFLVTMMGIAAIEEPRKPVAVEPIAVDVADDVAPPAIEQDVADEPATEGGRCKCNDESPAAAINPAPAPAAAINPAEIKPAAPAPVVASAPRYSLQPYTIRGRFGRNLGTGYRYVLNSAPRTYQQVYYSSRGFRRSCGPNGCN